MIKKFTLCILFLSLSILPSCTSIIPNKKVRIGIDPTFFSSPIGNKQGLVYAFSMELFEEIFKTTRYEVIYQQLSFDNTLESLDESISDLIVSSIPILFETNLLYTFSSTFLSLGDVFVTRRNEPSSNFKNYGGKIIAVANNPEIISLFADYPTVKLTYYTYIPEVLEKIANFSVDGAIVPYISLSSHLSAEYRQLLNIQSNRLTNTGLRLISLKNKNKSIIKTFNKRLATLIDNGTFEQLIIKWNLTL